MLLNRGWGKKKFTKALIHTAKSITPRVKSQARGQNKRSRALKWGVVHFCSSDTFRNTTRFTKLRVFKIFYNSQFLQYFQLQVQKYKQKIRIVRLK